MSRSIRPLSGRPKVSTKGAPARPADQPSEGVAATSAVDVFSRGVQLLQAHDYHGAQLVFAELVERFPYERALADRARTYAAACARELQHPSARTPQTAEERLTAATALLNDGDDERAEALVVLALENAPDHELAHYLLAVVHARRGATDAAIAALNQAIALSPDVRAQAWHDADFDVLRGHDAFEQMLVDPTAHSGNRRGLRATSGP